MKRNQTQHRVGQLIVAPSEDRVSIPERQTVGGAKSTGTGSVFKVTGAGISLEVHYVRWRNTEREVRCEAASCGPPAVLHLGSGRRRLEVSNVKSGPHARARRQYVVLKQARISDPLNGWSHLYGATADDLDNGAGFAVEPELIRAGAVMVGTRGDVLSEKGRSRAQLCAVFERDNETVPLVAFVVTRVLPLLNEVHAAK